MKLFAKYLHLNEQIRSGLENIPQLVVEFIGRIEFNLVGSYQLSISAKMKIIGPIVFEWIKLNADVTWKWTLFSRMFRNFYLRRYVS